MALYAPSSNVAAPELRGLSLCSGYGGLDLGIHIAEPRYHAVCYVEREAHAAATLVARMADAALAQAPVWSDLRAFDGKPWRGRIHILTAGYPCQPFSHAGKRAGRDDPRHLWPDVARVISECAPAIVFVENVEGHIDLGFAEVAHSLSRLGYHAKAGLFTAREAGARHRRRRLFIMAYANSQRRRVHARPAHRRGDDPDQVTVLQSSVVERSIQPHQCSARMEQAMDAVACSGVATDDDAPLFAPGPSELHAWHRLLDRHPNLQPALLRNDDGMADRVDRARGVGNGVCALAAALAWRTLSADFTREGWDLGETA